MTGTEQGGEGKAGKGVKSANVHCSVFRVSRFCARQGRGNRYCLVSEVHSLKERIFCARKGRCKLVIMPLLSKKTTKSVINYKMMI